MDERSILLLKTAITISQDMRIGLGTWMNPQFTIHFYRISNCGDVVQN